MQLRSGGCTGRHPPGREPTIRGQRGYGHCAGQNGAGKLDMVQLPCKKEKLHWGNNSFTATFFSLLKQSARSHLLDPCWGRKNPSNNNNDWSRIQRTCAASQSGDQPTAFLHGEGYIGCSLKYQLCTSWESVLAFHISLRTLRACLHLLELYFISLVGFLNGNKYFEVVNLQE